MKSQAGFFLDLRQLRYFVTVGEAKSLSAAARYLGLSQPSLSEQMRNLEEGLGVKLLLRSARGIRLTEAGQVLLERARELLAQADRLEADVRQVGSRVLSRNAV